MLPAHPFQALARSREIVAILLRQGFGELIERVGIPIPAALKSVKHHIGDHLPAAVRLRTVLEQLGSTFVKFGQVLSTRPDLVPPDYLEEFTRLQDQVPPVDYAAIVEVVRAELGGGPDDIFADFSVEPVAAASLAQVHRATTKAGMQVAVKVQRPKLRERIGADLDLLYFIARLLEEHIAELRHYQPTRIIDEFKYVLTRELNYHIELRTIERFRDNFRADPDLVIPRPVPELSTERVLTMEYLPGASLAECFSAPAAERKRLAALGLAVFLKQLFVHGCFHADPHPGNIRVLPDGRLALVDFGMVGRVMPELKFRLAALLEAVIIRDYPEAAALVLEIAETQEEIDEGRFVRDIADAVEYFYSERLADLHVGEALRHIATLALTYRLRLPPTLALMIKCLLTVEALGRALDPELNFIAALRPALRELVRERYSARRAVDILFCTLRDFTRLTVALPRDLRQIMGKLKHGDMSLELKHRNLDRLVSALDHSSNRVSFSMIIAALIVGSSLLVAGGGATQSWFGFGGFLVAMLFGIWLVVMIIRSGKL